MPWLIGQPRNCSRNPNLALHCLALAGFESYHELSRMLHISVNLAATITAHLRNCSEANEGAALVGRSVTACPSLLAPMPSPPARPSLAALIAVTMRRSSLTSKRGSQIFASLADLALDAERAAGDAVGAEFGKFAATNSSRAA